MANFVRLPVSEVHVLYNGALTITLQGCVHISLLTDVFLLWCIELGPRCLVRICGWLNLFLVSTSQSSCGEQFMNFGTVREHDVENSVMQLHLKYSISNHVFSHCAAVLTKPSYLVSQLQIPELFALSSIPLGCSRVHSINIWKHRDEWQIRKNSLARCLLPKELCTLTK